MEANGKSEKRVLTSAAKLWQTTSSGCLFTICCKNRSFLFLARSSHCNFSVSYFTVYSPLILIKRGFGRVYFWPFRYLRSCRWLIRCLWNASFSFDAVYKLRFLASVLRQSWLQLDRVLPNWKMLQWGVWWCRWLPVVTLNYHRITFWVKRGGNRNYNKILMKFALTAVEERTSNSVAPLL